MKRSIATMVLVTALGLGGVMLLAGCGGGGSQKVHDRKIHRTGGKPHDRGSYPQKDPHVHRDHGSHPQQKDVHRQKDGGSHPQKKDASRQKDDGSYPQDRDKNPPKKSREKDK